MIDLLTACNIAQEHMPGYQLCGAAELSDGFIFSFSTPEGEDLDIPPMLISKETGHILAYDYGERLWEIFNAESLDLSKL